MTTRTRKEIKRLRDALAESEAQRSGMLAGIQGDRQNRQAGAILAEQEAGQAALLVLRLEFQLAEERATAPKVAVNAELPYGVKYDDRPERIEHARRKALFYAGFADGLRRERAGK